MKLKEFLQDNNFICPDYNNLNIVDLVKVLYGRFGIDYENNKNTDYLEKLIPDNKHILLVISDGTGVNLLDKLPNESILKQNKKEDLITVFPSTTGCVLTSVVTATFPEEHGIWGWFNYNRQLNLEYYPLLFKDRESLDSLEKCKVLPEDIYKAPSFLNSLKGKVSVIFPASINDSVYSRFVASDNIRYSYNNFSDIKGYIDKIVSENNKSYTYLYIPDVDTLEHKYGIDSKMVLDKLLEIDKLITDLAKYQDLTILFTADHGQVNLKKRLILDLDKYNKYFYALPTIDFSTASYYVKKEYEEEFIKEFEIDFKDEMFLFKTDEFIKNKMFGLGNFSDYSRDNLGDFISICKAGNYFLLSDDLEEFKGGHSGLTKDEMMIPLVVIDTNNKNI